MIENIKIPFSRNNFKIQSRNRGNRGTLENPNPSLLLGTGTLIKCGEVKLVLWVQNSPLSEKI